MREAAVRHRISAAARRSRGRVVVHTHAPHHHLSSPLVHPTSIRRRALASTATTTAAAPRRATTAAPPPPLAAVRRTVATDGSHNNGVRFVNLWVCVVGFLMQLWLVQVGHRHVIPKERPLAGAQPSRRVHPRLLISSILLETARSRRQIPDAASASRRRGGGGSKDPIDPSFSPKGSSRVPSRGSPNRPTH